MNSTKHLIVWALAGWLTSLFAPVYAQAQTDDDPLGGDEPTEGEAEPGEAPAAPTEGEAEPEAQPEPEAPAETAAPEAEASGSTEAKAEAGADLSLTGGMATAKVDAPSTVTEKPTQ